MIIDYNFVIVVVITIVLSLFFEYDNFFDNFYDDYYTKSSLSTTIISLSFTSYSFTIFLHSIRFIYLTK